MLMIGGGSSDCSMVRELYSSSTIGECYWGLCSSIQAHLLGHYLCTYIFALFYKPWQNNHSSNSWMTGDFVYLKLGWIPISYFHYWLYVTLRGFNDWLPTSSIGETLGS